VDLLIQGEFGWDPEARPWHSGAPMGAPKKMQIGWSMFGCFIWAVGQKTNSTPVVHLKIAGIYGCE